MCFTLQYGKVLHEIGHALGAYHEQKNPDRIHYINILYENIRDGKNKSFDFPGLSIDDFDQPYDFGSVMHYSRGVSIIYFSMFRSLYLICRRVAEVLLCMFLQANLLT